MNTNEIILSSLKGYLASCGAEEKTTIPDRFSVWYDRAHSLEVILPAEELVNHSQSDEMLTEAIFNLSKAYGFSFDIFRKKLLHDDSDILQVRSSGKNVNHGSINFSEGLSALNGLYEIIKASANAAINVKGKKKAVHHYLSGVNMLAPKAGSFIYTVELQLLDTEEGNNASNAFKQEVSLSRYVNSNLAIVLARISEKINLNEHKSPAKLLSFGVNSSFCNNFLNLFSKSADQLEFVFDWSFREEVYENVPSKVIFNANDREKIEQYKNLLKKSHVKKYKDLPAYIEKYSWPIEDECGRVYLRLLINDRSYSCYIEVDSKLYETLKAEHAKKQIAVTCELLITSGVKTAVDIFKMHSIKLSENFEIDFSL
ncbi:hypothetical protein [Halomonas citrativorans]|uniref:Uncharacterized protein n=1 Tax=Halomonas citrativorans TaxID=2742612 RepID=A0ABR9FBU5_9GAMM|nr:hypothetical protein [Halomonas citrativorans]MBE0403965.1 hypothetical protein [Halomonas citrativorans]